MPGLWGHPRGPRGHRRANLLCLPRAALRNSQEARANVYVRFHQGYKGRDLIRELSLLRITLLDHLLDISSDETLAPDPESSHNAARILNLYLDEEMRYAISVYANAPGSPERSSSDSSS